MARSRTTRRRRIVLGCVLSAVLSGAGARAEDAGSEIRELRNQVEELLRRDAERERRVRELERRLGEQPAEAPRADAVPAPDPAADALDRAVADAAAKRPAPERGLAQASLGPATARLLDLSLDLLAAAGGSTEDDETVRNLQGGGHDPRRNGFTLQQVELSGMGAVDPYFTAESHIVFFLDPEDDETVVELEEAFATTQALPYGLQIEAGQFLTEFGRMNPTHSHAWHWMDQPIVNTRLFGADGIRNPGARLGWLLPVPWFSQLHLGVQNATGATMASFLGGSVAHDHGGEEGESHAHLARRLRPLEHEDHDHADDHEDHGDEDPDHGEDDHAHELDFEEGIGGRPIVGRSVRGLDDLVYLARFENGFDLGPSWSTKLGASGLFGPNATGSDGRTRVYGADAVFKWRPERNFRGWPFVLLEGEILKRDFRADRFEDEDGDVLFGKRTLHDWGFYAQGLYGFAYAWAGGLRFEYASGDGPTAETGRSADPFRDDRFRFSPLLVHHLSEFSRLRLQYNLDDADHLDDPAHSVWFGMEVLFGAHPAHAY
jgi:hypothetical protein